MSAPIEVSALTKTFGRIRGIEDVSFTVNRGEVFGFLGPNGAGESTTIRLIRPGFGGCDGGAVGIEDGSPGIVHDDRGLHAPR